MTSDRPYRKALPIGVAIKELVDNAGSQFDPELVTLFVELLNDSPLSPPVTVRSGTIYANV
jgi:HD-GYP domain-containing protein (c-di-GMP phosphodiesterase class II)